MNWKKSENKHISIAIKSNDYKIIFNFNFDLLVFIKKCKRNKQKKKSTKNCPSNNIGK